MVFNGAYTDDNNVGANWEEEVTVTYGVGDFGSPGSQGTNEVPVELMNFEIE